MDEGAAEKMAEKPEHTREAGGGTAEVAGGGARQTSTAQAAVVGAETSALLEEVLRRGNLAKAYARVVRNGGAPGVDGITVQQFKSYLGTHWPRVREELLKGEYQPQAVRRVEIPKPDGGTRALGIPTVLDRFIQQALLQVLQPLIDPSFSEASFGFRPGRSAHDAVRRAQQHVAAGYRWVVDLDLEKFFDRVNHDVLIARVARRISDKRVLLLIRRSLQAGMMEGGLVSPRTEGTPQGGPLSPFLSNILLDELDRELERRGHRFVRYADDCNIYVQSAQAVERPPGVLELFEQHAVARGIANIIDDASPAIRQRCSSHRPTVTVHMQDSTRIAEQVESSSAIEADTYRCMHFPDLLRRGPPKQRKILKAAAQSLQRLRVILPR